ncbi:HTH domain-containing protein [Breznakia pachnodae]|uniref:Transcriptional antiterminator n=1 Tax=Breznakia pachnodae TaxID=265178 RepID=A0ABU0E3K2_9FIRM|nr:HTH domain-containing protein [Breznakia pachnodae]MDQ0361473.1 transcriptional antiterminator [Breznakia pachnodae]
MLTKKELKILKQFSNCNYVKSRELEELLDVSNKTARKMISQLSDKIKFYGAVIESKPGKGYILEVRDEELFNKIFDEKEIVFVDSESRWEYLVKLFIESDTYLKIDDLAEDLYVSRKVISNSIKTAEEFLNIYNLYLIRKPHYGIQLTGEEYDKRR